MATVSAVVEQSTRRAREAEHARAEVDRAETVARTNELRGAILSAVSHDLRTPLDSIKTAALEELPEAPTRVAFDVPESLPLLHVDPVLAERVLANITSNALSLL